MSRDGLIGHCKTCKVEYERQRYAANAEAIKERSRLYRERIRERLREQARNYHETNKVAIKARRRARGYRPPPLSAEQQSKKARQFRERLTSVREEVLDHYGRTCACCGESESMFLQIDHVDGVTPEVRKLQGGGLKMCRWLKLNNFPEGFRILCANCNHAMGRRDNPSRICPHQMGVLKLVIND